jgi:hypothetical protein
MLRGGSLSATVHGNAAVNFAKESFATKLKLTARESAITADVKMQGLAQPEYSFDIAVDRLDLDALLAGKPVAASSLPPTAAGAEKIDPIARLRALTADGVVRVGKLKSGGNSASNVRIEVKSKNR